MITTMGHFSVVRDTGSDGDMALFLTLFVACFVEVMLIKAITDLASAANSFAAASEVITRACMWSRAQIDKFQGAFTWSGRSSSDIVFQGNWLIQINTTEFLTYFITVPINTTEHIKIYGTNWLVVAQKNFSTKYFCI